MNCHGELETPEPILPILLSLTIREWHFPVQICAPCYATPFFPWSALGSTPLQSNGDLDKIFVNERAKQSEFENGRNRVFSYYNQRWQLISCPTSFYPKQERKSFELYRLIFYGLCGAIAYARSPACYFQLAWLDALPRQSLLPTRMHNFF